MRSAVQLASILLFTGSLLACGRSTFSLRGPGPSRPSSALDPNVSEITFGHRVAVVGDHVRISEDSEAVMTITAQAPGRPALVKSFDRIERAVREELVLVVGPAGMPAATRVTYFDRSHIDRIDGKETRKRDPVVGRTYVIGAKGGVVQVFDLDGKPSPQAEAEIVRKDYKFRRFVIGGSKPNGKGAPSIGGAVADPSIHVGDESPRMEKMFVDDVISAGDGHSKADDVSVVFRGLRLGASVAEFETRATMIIDFPAAIPFRMTTALSGSWGVDPATCEQVDLDLAGPIEIVSLDPKIGRMDGTGRMRITATREHLPAEAP